MKSSTTHPKIEEKIEILSGPVVTIDRTLKDFSLVKEKVDSCVDSTGASVILSTPPIKNAFMKLKRRGIKTRYITEITKENLPYCKELMELVGEIRHLDNVKGNFGLTEFSYIGTATAEYNMPLSEMLLSTVKSFNAQQQYFFDMLWNKAIPAWQRIKEIEDGLERQTIETIYGSENVLSRVIDQLTTAQDQVLLVLSADTPNSIGTQILDSIRRLSFERRSDLSIRILISSKNKKDYKTFLSKINGHKRYNIEIRFLEPSIHLSLSMMVIDQIKFASFDLRSNYDNQTMFIKNLSSTPTKRKMIKYDNEGQVKKDISKSVDNMIDHCTFTNSIPAVRSYIIIFETLWHQLDLYKQIMQVCKYLRSRDVAIQEFVNITAHEISNPLQTIISLSDMLTVQEEKGEVDHDNVNSEKRELMDTLLSNATKLYQLSKDILDTSRLEHGSLSLEKEKCDIIGLIRSIIKGYSKNTIRKVPIELDINLSNIKQKTVKAGNDNSSKEVKTPTKAISLMISIDKHRMAQVFSNLLDNAIKFTNKGKITIFVESIPDSNNIMIKVVDTGSGLDTARLNKLFTRFNSTSKRGTGLGLYICRKIVELHGGKIWAENNKNGSGSTFKVLIPIS